MRVVFPGLSAQTRCFWSGALGAVLWGCRHKLLGCCSQELLAQTPNSGRGYWHKLLGCCCQELLAQTSNSGRFSLGLLAQIPWVLFSGAVGTNSEFRALFSGAVGTNSLGAVVRSCWHKLLILGLLAQIPWVLFSGAIGTNSEFRALFSGAVGTNSLGAVFGSC